MYFLKRLVPLLVVANLGFGLRPYAQLSSNAQYVPNYISPSPNAAALMKFSDVPVSPYTGTADVTVPIYTIQAKGISVPISLDYHTGGVKLKEEASSVGLGWALNAGGRISRTIMNYDDFGTQYPYFTTVVPQLAGDISITQPEQATNVQPISPYFFDFFCNYNLSTTQGTENLWWAFQSGVAAYDMEPDIFSYNFPGHSGKFILTRTGQVVMQKQENIVIQFQGTGSTATFSLKDEQGNTYYFNALELSYPSGTAAEPISSWLLSKIVTQQQDSVKFTYESGGASNNVAPDINQTYNYYCSPTQGLFTTSASATSYDNKDLQSITFTGGELLFLYDNKRSDLAGGDKLDSVILYSANAAGTLTYQHEHDFYYSYFNASTGYPAADSLEYLRLKLDSVKEKSASGTLPPYSFIYNNPFPAGSSAKHSFSVDHWGYYNGAGNGTLLIPTLGIQYAPVQFNDMNQTEYLSYPGANREPSLPFMETFSLQQVNYPTGGSTVFQYQANDYDFNNSSAGANTSFSTVQLQPMDSIINIVDHGTTAGTINLTNIYPLLSTGSTGTNVTVSVTFRYQTNYGGHGEPAFPNIGSGKIQFSLTGPGVNSTSDIANATCDTGSPVCTVSYPLTITSGENTIFNWSGLIASSVDTTVLFSEIQVNIQYQVTQQTFNLLQNNPSLNYISPAAGLRIQSVTNYKDPSTIASEKVYNYGYLEDKLGTGTPQQYSYGRLMSFPSYVNYAFTVSSGNHCTQISLFSGSNTALTSAITGNIVGYDQVTETSIDPITGLDIGMTVYSYYNSNDTAKSASGFGFPGTLNMGYSLDGLLKSKVVYADYKGIYTPVTQETNYYHTTNRIVYYSPKYTYTGQQGNYLSCAVDTAVQSEALALFYPSIKSERILLDSSVNLVYAQQNAAQFALTHSYNYYDNPLHYQVTRSSTVDSKGDTLVTKIKYPQDYIPSGQQVTGNTILDSMIGRNMVSETIEKQDSFYYPGSSAGYITGAQLSLFRISSGSSYNTIVPDRTYKLAVNSPVTNFQPFAISGNTTSLDSRYRQMISFDQYDGYNNLQQYTPVDQNSVNYIWDYLHTYPIAQVKNAVLADVAATSFEADGTGNWTYAGASTADTTTVTGSLCYNLGQSGGNITKSGLTSATTYVLSYWIKGTSPLSITGTISGYPIQGKTIKGWTYFEHKFTGQTGITVSGTSYIDELRLYPATAQMSTYTYSPLVGQTTVCDVDNKVTYYFYDAYQRLKRIKDQDGNIIKTFQYHYANQNPFNQ
jgi:hypothetical protein